MLKHMVQFCNFFSVISLANIIQNISMPSYKIATSRNCLSKYLHKLIRSYNFQQRKFNHLKIKRMDQQNSFAGWTSLDPLEILIRWWFLRQCSVETNLVMHLEHWIIWSNLSHHQCSPLMEQELKHWSPPSKHKNKERIAWRRWPWSF